MKQETIRRKLHNLGTRRNQIQQKIDKLQKELAECDAAIEKNREQLDLAKCRKYNKPHHSRVEYILDQISKQLKEV